ncbi:MULTISPECIES: hypothetical protein [Rhodococcus]|uniref:hypothetical protein n=1 Tax=Rhodococcus sp. DN22 TaxID=357684 RepID=UPI0022AAB463|nr:hypothetical protein [Rhodococcus erythropolis]
MPAGPDFVGGGAAAAVQLPGDPLTDLGDHEVGEGDEMPLVDCDPRVRQGGADPARVRRGRVDHDQVDAGPERGCLQREPVDHARPGASRGQPEKVPGQGGVGVDERGHPRVRPCPAGLFEHPAHRPGAGLVDAEHAGGFRLGQPLVGQCDERPVRGRPRHLVLASDLADGAVARRDRRTDLLS